MDVASLQVIIKTQGVEAAQRELDKLGKSANNTEKQTNSLSSSFKGLSIVASGMALGKVATEFIQVADAMKLLEARIKLVSNATENYASLQKNLNVIANQNGVKIKEIGDLYTKLSMSLKPLGVTTNSVMQVTDAFSKTLLISGASIAEASSATLQFSQAMASGRLQGDEFRSMAENSPRFMKAMTESLGKTSAEIRQMAEDGKLTTSVVGGALVDSMAKLREEARSMPMTVGKAFNELKNEATLTVEQFDKLTGINDTVAKGFQRITEKVVGLREELPKLSAEMTKWEKEHETGIYTLKLLGGAALDMSEKLGKTFIAIETVTAKKGMGNFLDLVGKIGESTGISTNEQILFNKEMEKQTAITEKNTKAKKEQAKAIEDEVDGYVAKQEFKNINPTKEQVKAQLKEWEAYHKAIGNKEEELQFKRLRYAEEYKTLNASQIDEMINAERDKNTKAESLAQKWADRKLEIQTEMSISEQDEIAKPFLKLQLEYQKDLEEFKSVVGAKELLAKNFNAEYQRLGLDTTKKLDEKAQKEKQKDIQKELKLQEENFRIQARQVDLLDDEADRQVALATLERQRTEASLKAQVLLGEKSPEYYNAMMEMEDKLLEKQKQNWTIYGQIINNTTGAMESSFMDFFDATSDGYMKLGELAKNILQEMYREALRVALVKPLVGAATSAMMSGFDYMLGGAGTTSAPTASAPTASTYDINTGGSLTNAYFKPNAKGGAYNSPSLSQYSNQIVDKPTFFAFAQGGTPNMGVMGEAGSEAIMPLTRTSSGDLGVKAIGGGSNVVINISNETGIPIDLKQIQQSKDDKGNEIRRYVMKFASDDPEFRNALGISK